MSWRIEYRNDVGADDDCFWEWWEVTDDLRCFKCDAKEDAEWLLDFFQNVHRHFSSIQTAKRLGDL